jgi:hypothetical protein
VAHGCNLSYTGGRDREDGGLRPGWANSFQDPISKISNIKTDWIVDQLVECLPSKCEALSSNPNTAPQNEIIQKKFVENNQ